MVSPSRFKGKADAVDPELAALCRQQVTVEPQAGVTNSAASPSYGSKTTYQARVENKTEYRMSPNGDVMQTKGRVYLVPNGSVVPRPGIDRITLPETETPRQQPIVDVSTEVDEDGALDHIVVYF